MRQPGNRPEPADATPRCDHASAPFQTPPVPDDSPRCPDCGERVAYHAGEVFTRRELNERITELWNAVRSARGEAA